MASGVFSHGGTMKSSIGICVAIVVSVGATAGSVQAVGPEHRPAPKLAPRSFSPVQAQLEANVPTVYTSTPYCRDTAANTPPQCFVMPKYLTVPSNGDAAKAYPKGAIDDEIEGRVDVECQWIATGRVTNCRVVSENPPGNDFGAATVALFQDYLVVDVAAMGPPQANTWFRAQWKWYLGI